MDPVSCGRQCLSDLTCLGGDGSRRGGIRIFFGDGSRSKKSTFEVARRTISSMGRPVVWSQQHRHSAVDATGFDQARLRKLLVWSRNVPDRSDLLRGSIFLSDGWWSLTRPSSSHLTIASSSLACSTVPNAPVGFPKLPKPSTRSPGFNSWLVIAASASGGFLARSESGVAPACARGGWGALRNLGIGLLVIWLIFERFLSERQTPPLAARVHRLYRYSIGSEGLPGWSEVHSPGNWTPISGERTARHEGDRQSTQQTSRRQRRTLPRL